MVARRDTSIRDGLGRKQCKTCMNWLPVDRFNKHHTTRDRLYIDCKECLLKRGNAQRQYRKHGLTEDELVGMFANQGDACAICSRGIALDGKYAVDHDHGCCPTSERSCGNCVRGIVCPNCNTGLGMFQDSTTVLEQAIRYLRDSRQGALV